MKEELICLVEEFGSAHAEKSKLLHGITHEILATFGLSTSIDAAAVGLFPSDQTAVLICRNPS
jgi:putative Mn2+ efflux pump MntP